MEKSAEITKRLKYLVLRKGQVKYEIKSSGRERFDTLQKVTCIIIVSIIFLQQGH